MASRAVKSDKLSNLHWVKTLYFVFNLFILKNQINDLVVLVNSTKLSKTTERHICCIQL